jgi:hypothetical protein
MGLPHDFLDGVAGFYVILAEIRNLSRRDADDPAASKDRSNGGLLLYNIGKKCFLHPFGPRLRRASFSKRTVVSHTPSLSASHNGSMINDKNMN